MDGVRGVELRGLQGREDAAHAELIIDSRLVLLHPSPMRLALHQAQHVQRVDAVVLWLLVSLSYILLLLLHVDQLVHGDVTVVCCVLQTLIDGLVEGRVLRGGYP